MPGARRSRKGPQSKQAISNCDSSATGSACRCVSVFANTAFSWLRAVSREIPSCTAISSSAAPPAIREASLASAAVSPSSGASNRGSGPGFGPDRQRSVARGLPRTGSSRRRQSAASESAPAACLRGASVRASRRTRFRALVKPADTDRPTAADKVAASARAQPGGACLPARTARPAPSFAMTAPGKPVRRRADAGKPPQSSRIDQLIIEGLSPQLVTREQILSMMISPQH
jgi:hypothetical protein